MKLPAYPRYKPSLPAEAAAKAGGVEWLGDVPEHWEVKRIKHLGSIRYGLGEPPEYVDEGLSFVRATDIKRGKINLDEVKKVRSEDVPWSRKPLLNLEEILVVRSGAYTGDSAIVSSSVAGSIAGYDMVLSVKRGQPAFVAWALLSKYLLQGQIYLERMRAAQPHLNAEELGGFLILTPPPAEQRSIAAFLDRETGRVDRLVAKKRELIERLKEKRTALISRTVTRGLPAEAAAKAGLPAKPPLKPSALDWLGDIPKHWDVKRIKQLGAIRYGLGEPPEYVNEGLPFVRATDIKHGKINLDEVRKVRSEDVPWSRKPLLNLQEILVVRSGAYTGDSAIVTSSVAGCVAGYDMVLSVKRGHPGFVAWALLSKYLLQGQIYLERMRAAQPHLNAEELGGFLILTPPLPEQAAIAAYLDEETGKLDALVVKVEEAVERLQEYHTALITAAVTGKIDVRKAQTP